MTRPFYGWYLVAYSVLCQAILVGTTQTSFGLYVVPVSHEFGLSRADMNLGIILLNLGGALFAPIAGWLSDRVSLRLLMISGAVLVAGTFGMLSLSTSALLSAFLLGFVLMAGMSAVARPETVLVVRWFDARRGRALALAAMGLSLSSIVVAPMVGLAIGELGWRSALLISGGVAAAAAAVPLLFLRMVPTAEEKAREVPPAAPAGSETTPADPKPISIGALLRMPAFWLIGFAVAIPMSVSQGVVISLVPMAVESGMPVALAATLLSFSGMTAITAKLGLAVIADKVNQMTLLLAMFCIGAIENVLLFVVAGQNSYAVLAICAVFQGLSSGMLMPLFNALIARRFGTVSFGTVLGMIFPIIAVNNAIFARYIGEVYDRTGSYRLAFLSFAAMEVLAIGLMLIARRQPLTRTDQGVKISDQTAPQTS